MTISEKIYTPEQLLPILQKLQSEEKKIVWTNGCYDILHAGHVLYLEQAKKQGDVLVVGLNSDASVQKNKGPLRPVVSEQNRATLLAALGFVDYITIFDDESPINIINMLRPDIYAKGGDYNMQTVNQPEKNLVESYGGQVALLPGVEGLSTSAIINRILKAYANE